ncbi:acetyl-CoA carboxylase 1, partial [Tanacetum coccineum]
AFEAALENIRSKLPSETRPEAKLVNVREIAFADPKVSRFPYGRTIMVVANDITYKNGSFAPIEDAFFEATTDLECAKKNSLSST